MKPLPPLDEAQLQTAVHAALTEWTRGAQGDLELARHLLLVRLKLSEAQLLGERLDERQATLALLDELLSELSQRDANAARVLRLRFYDGEITRQVAARLYASPDQVNRWQRSAIDHVTSLLMSREMAERERHSQRLLEDLPAAPYTRLFGFEQLQSEIAGQLLRSGEPLVIALAGIGGIGKTSLADAVARLVAPALAFEQIVWLRATMEPFASEDAAGRSWAQIESSLQLALDVAGAESAQALQMRLKERLRCRPILVILDNLEQEDQTILFLEKVRELGGQGKYLLTTRARPAVSAPAYFRSLQELDFADAVALLRFQGRTTGTRALAGMTDDDLRTVYNVTGGNPLALRLVAGLAAVLPLSEIVNGLEQSRPGPIESLYRAVYWEAWRTLSPAAKALLQGMPLVAESGASPEQLMAIGEMGEEAFWPAVHELFARSLLEVRGTVHDRRYSIHHLTETFLRTEIIGWPADK